MTHPKILLVDDNSILREMVQEILEEDGFQVVAVASVNQALNRIAIETFEVLLTDLHMPGAGDGFTVVSAMRHSNPAALTLVYTGFPAVDAAMRAITLQADEILVKPLDPAALTLLIRERLQKATPRPLKAAHAAGVILSREAPAIVQEWLRRVHSNERLRKVPLAEKDRIAHLPDLLNETVERLLKPHTMEGHAEVSRAAALHGRIRQKQGYTAAMLVEESRILQVSVFHALHRNLNTIDFSLILVDVMTIADELDSQLAQTVECFLAQSRSNAAQEIGQFQEQR
jgi:DNA-binding response OmpR family regulator